MRKKPHSLERGLQALNKEQAFTQSKSDQVVSSLFNSVQIGKLQTDKQTERWMDGWMKQTDRWVGGWIKTDRTWQIQCLQIYVLNER